MEDLLFLVPKSYSGTTSLLLESAKDLKIRYEVALIEHIKLIAHPEGISIFHRDYDISYPSYVFPRIDGIRKNEGYKILLAYELNNVKKPYPADSINIVHDKFLTSLYLSKKGIRVPYTIYTKSLNKLDLSNINFPIILKLLSGSGGKGVMFVDDEDSFMELVNTLHTDKNTEFLIQEYLQVEHPYDIRILLAGGQLIGSMKRIAKSGEIRANVKAGGRVENYVPTPEEMEMAIKSLEVLNIDIGAVDLISLPNGETYVIELNLNPGIRGLMEATGKNIAEKIMMYVKEQMRK